MASISGAVVLSTNKLKICKIAANGTQATILKVVRDNSPISRSGIVSHSGLPHAAVSRSVGMLLERGIVTESTLADTNGPRRKRGIMLNPEYGYCLAAEYGPSRIEGVIFNTAYGQVLNSVKEVPLGPMRQAEKIHHIKSFIEELRKQAPADGQCLGLGIIDPGIVSEQRGMALVSSTMADWHNVPIVQILEDHFSLPVMLLNTSMSKIRAVDRFEVKGASDNLIYVEYGEGIGCGLKLEGNYITGQSCLAGELGHLRVTDKAVPCQCGGLGCLESVSALPALAREAQEALRQSSRGLLTKLDQIDGSAVLNAASDGDRLASHIVDEAFDYLARAVAGLVNIVNPEIVVFDNMIGKAGDEAVNALMRSLSKNILTSHWESLEARISTIKSHIGALGGAAAVLDHCLDR
ncbi:MAG: ROK family transcriptional regulator [Planctomycetota bacterium]